MPAIERVRCGEVEGIRVGRFPGRINTAVFLFRWGETLIDTGPANQWRAVDAFTSASPVRRVVVTHHHEDHAGNLARFARRGIEALYAPDGARAWLEGGFELQFYRRVVWGAPGRVRTRPLPSRLEIAPGVELEAVPAPGHSPDMTCLLERRRGILFAADLYVASRIVYLRADEDLSRMLETLKHFLTLEFDTLLCGHRGVLDHGRERLRRKLDSLQSLREETRLLHGRGLPVGEITRRLLGREDFLSWVSGGHYSKRNLIRACL